MEHYFNNQSLPHDAQIYRKKLAVLFAVTKTIFYRIRLRSLIQLIRSLTNDRRRIHIMLFTYIFAVYIVMPYMFTLWRHTCESSYYIFLDFMTDCVSYFRRIIIVKLCSYNSVRQNVGLFYRRDNQTCARAGIVRPSPPARLLFGPARLSNLYFRPGPFFRSGPSRPVSLTLHQPAFSIIIFSTSCSRPDNWLIKFWTLNVALD